MILYRVWQVAFYLHGDNLNRANLSSEFLSAYPCEIMDEPVGGRVIQRYKCTLGDAVDQDLMREKFGIIDNLY
jgi:hypothetical protein